MIDQRNTEHQSLCTSNPFLYSRVMDIERLLNMAFNPVTELRSKTPLAMLLNKHSNIVPVENTLTSAERIAESAVVRNNLENNLSHTDFRVLQIYYQRTIDFENALVVIRPIINSIIKTARLLPSQTDVFFASLCCLSEAWKINLFLDKRYGPAHRYYTPMQASRKRRRLTQALEAMRKQAMTRAERVLFD